MKLSWQSYSQRVILGIIVGIICLNSILLPTAINSWKVTPTTAEIFSPLIQAGDRVLTDRLFYRISRLKLGDIIILEPTSEMSYPLGSTSKGLVIGCPGDAVIISQGKIIFNGKSLPNKYLGLKAYPNLPEYFINSIPNNSYLVFTKKYGNETSFIIAQIPVFHVKERAFLRIWPSFDFI